jgi:hypothetical protein
MELQYPSQLTIMPGTYLEKIMLQAERLEASPTPAQEKCFWQIDLAFVGALKGIFCVYGTFDFLKVPQSQKIFLQSLCLEASNILCGKVLSQLADDINDAIFLLPPQFKYLECNFESEPAATASSPNQQTNESLHLRPLRLLRPHLHPQQQHPHQSQAYELVSDDRSGTLIFECHFHH